MVCRPCIDFQLTAFYSRVDLIFLKLYVAFLQKRLNYAVYRFPSTVTDCIKLTEAVNFVTVKN